MGRDVVERIKIDWPRGGEKEEDEQRKTKMRREWQGERKR